MTPDPQGVPALRMKALVRRRYGPPEVLRFDEVDKPVPGEGEVLVRVLATSLNKADKYELNPPFMIRMVSGGGRLKPKEEKIGTDIAGVVDSVGGNVKGFKPGDEVFGGGRWSFAEFAIAREDRLAMKSGETTFEESATLPIAATTALQALRKAELRAGQRVLVDGASGGVGTFIVQMAKAMGAVVTAVCSARNLDSARAMGADRVIDYAKEDFTKGQEKYDLILQVNGSHSITAYGRALAPNGRYLMVGSPKPIRQLVQTLLLGRLLSRGGKKLGFMGIAKLNQEDFYQLNELLKSKKVRPVVDRRFPFASAAEAFRYFEEGHASGKVVVFMGEEPGVGPRT